jgi:hypothetical protein
MHHTEPHELGVLETRYQLQHPRLFAPFQLCLKADEAEVIPCECVLTQLHDRVRRPSGVRIDEADWLHRPEPQRVTTAVRHDLDRQTAFKEFLFVEIVDGCGFGRDDRVIEPLVLFPRQRTVQVVAFVGGIRNPGSGMRRNLQDLTRIPSCESRIPE